MRRILVVGAGITGALTVSLLRHNLGKSAQLVIWEQSSDVGGRMCTRESTTLPGCTVDLGAQYITASPTDYDLHKRFYEELESAGVLRPMLATIGGINDLALGTRHFVAPVGISSVARHFIEQAVPVMNYDCRLSSLDIPSDVSSEFRALADNGSTGVFDAVVLTMPVPQMLQLGKSMTEILKQSSDIEMSLKMVDYSSRFAVGLFYPPGTALNFPWAASYIKDNDCIRFISVDQKKRGVEGQEDALSVLIHTGVPFGLQHLEEEESQVGAIVLKELKKLYPDIPDPDDIVIHKWRHSQVFKCYPDQPGYVVLCDEPLLICAGDSFSRSGFDGCIDSAVATVEFLKSKLL